jgi:hypothetical protein
MPNKQYLDSRMKNILISIISLLKHKAEDKGLKPVISVAKLIDLLKVSGMTITYQQLLDLSKDPAIASSIKEINKTQVELSLSDDEEENFEPNTDENSNNADNSAVTDNEEEFKPDDFAVPDSNEAPSTTPTAVSPENSQIYTPKQSIVGQMARRASHRPD